MVWSIACSNSKLDYVGATIEADCISEVWLEEPESGGVAAYGSTVASYTTANHELDRELFDAVYDEGITTHAQAIADAEAEMTLDSPTYGAKNSWRYLLLGDPEMTVRRGYPEIAIDPPGGFDPGPGLIDIYVEDLFGDPVEQALVALWKPGPGGGDDVFANKYTDANGLAQIVIDATIAGVLQVTARDCDGNEAVAQVPVGCGPVSYGDGLGAANVFEVQHVSGLAPGDSVVYAVDETGYVVEPGTPVIFVFSAGQAQFPLFGGTGLIDPAKIVQVQADPFGPDIVAQTSIAIPPVKGLEGKTMFVQAFHPSSLHPGGFAMSNGSALTFCPIGG